MVMPVDSYSKAASAYAKLARGDQPVAANDADGKQSFANMVKDVLETAAESGKSAEAASVAAVGSGTDLTQVVTAVAEAETTLQTVVAVRDRIIDAYKEILRMPM
ncbi:MAG: flagellar hook-basal body complex protein FliE [Rhodospirillales bacterium]|nr:flagellar hook-basal body complex protein FliE [Rhodospirillales bacterium]